MGERGHAAVTRIEIDGRVWTSPDNLPEYVKFDDVFKVIKAETQHAGHGCALDRMKDIRLGYTLRVRIPPVFKPSKDLFDGIIGFDKWGPIRAPDPTMPFTWTENVSKPQAPVHQEGTGESL